ncbi:NADPH:quinone reductase [Mucilaginibacter pineti]|uniref:NADPH:quinone reductase n=1 Tax=Mucilaginibacter pineti TaxID=1391627 RepID=A0A1G7LZD4_9SPHI|nr:NADP-dependent oxidoreductase [Mucilaginibacter pineti]SDF54756.1 NADPH:quinone reductase [Mucilaginibacter pineti]
MKAITLNGFGGVDNLTLVEVPVPAIQNDEVLIKVKYLSINPVDAKARLGKSLNHVIKDKLPVILGWDLSGVITQVGADVSDLKVGDEVFSMIAFPQLGSAYAEYVAAKANELALKPANITHNEAAAATLAALTAWQNLTTHGNVKAGDKVLIHAASGGVGHYAVQMAKHLGAYVIGTSSAANKDFVLSLGADEHIDYKTQDFDTILSDVDFVLNAFGGEDTDRSIAITKKGGKVLTITGPLHDSSIQKGKDAGVTSVLTMVKANGDDMKAIADLLEKGIVKSHVSKTFPFEKMAEAHTQIESGRTIGRITLEL